MQTVMNALKTGILALTLTLSTITGLVTKANAQTIKNVVLVHGAFADGSGWRALYDVLTKKGFHVSADVPTDLADFMYASQGAFYAKGFTTPITHAAWRDKPAFACIATEDKSINPDIQRAMYKRSNTKTMDVKGSHVIFMSQPDAVAKMIEEASKVSVK
jgi:hypothetical protein